MTFALQVDASDSPLTSLSGLQIHSYCPGVAPECNQEVLKYDCWFLSSRGEERRLYLISTEMLIISCYGHFTSRSGEAPCPHCFSRLFPKRSEHTRPPQAGIFLPATLSRRVSVSSLTLFFFPGSQSDGSSLVTLVTRKQGGEACSCHNGLSRPIWYVWKNIIEEEKPICMSRLARRWIGGSIKHQLLDEAVISTVLMSPAEPIMYPHPHLCDRWQQGHHRY